MREVGVKVLDRANWLEQDPVLEVFCPKQETHGFLDDMLAPRLAEEVPDEIFRMYEAARAVVAYGHFCYPLCTLGAEQCFRVADAALAVACKRHGAPPGVKTFAARIDWMRGQGRMSTKEADQWHVARALRNRFSHAESQSILPPQMAIGVLERTAQRINALFAARPAPASKRP